MSSLVHRKERLYFGLSLVISILVYLALIVSIVGLIYLIIGAVIGLVAHGLFIGNIRGNGVRVSDRQFAEVYHIAQKICEDMGIDKVPKIYVLESGGLLNAFATRFLGRNFVVIYSDILEVAYKQGEEALAFVVAHELAHIKCKHLTRRWFLYPALLIPFLGSAYSRACEYTCDLMAAHYQPEGAVPGLLILAVGKNLYEKVNLEEFIIQAEEENDFWVWFAEILATHPYLPKRVRALMGTKAVINSDYVEEFGG